MDQAYGAGERITPGEKRFGGMTVPEPAFAGDDGTADPVLGAAIAAFDRGAAPERRLLLALRGARLMVPLVAVLDSLDDDPDASAPGPGEKDSHMATVSLVAHDGRRGLLAFTSVSAMAAWDPTARGIPATARTVAEAAVEEGADAVLLDLGGPVRTAISADGVSQLARGGPWPPDEDPDLRAAVAEVVAAIPEVASCDVAPGEDATGADVLVLLSLRADADPVVVGGRVLDALDAHPAVAARVMRGIALGLLDVS